jgi:FAD:protein FMN transferase
MEAENLMRIHRAFFLIFTFTLLLAQGCTGNGYEKFSDTRIAMGTSLTITFFSYDQKKAKSLINQCYDLASTLENKVSVRINNSVISKLNKEKDLIIDDDFVYNLIVEALKYSKETNGTFDPSLYNLISLWGFDTDKINRVPTEAEISSTLQSTGYKNIFIENNRVILKNNVSLDLGGIAKGKIISEIRNLLNNNKITDFIINGGGDLIVSGKYEGKRLWKIAITDPFDANRFLGVMELSDCRVATSGDYERNFIGPDGKFYHHIFDPKTGYPAENNVHSVTLISYIPLRNDIFPSVSFFVMGTKTGLDFVKKENNISLIYVIGNKDDMKILTTDDISMNKKDNDQYDFAFKRFM